MKVIHLLLITLLSTSFSHAQNFLGIHTGYNAATLFDYSRNDDYKSNYTIKSGVGLSAFYEGVYEENASNYKVELQYGYQEADFEVSNKADHSYTNMAFTWHQLNLNLAYSFSLLKRNAVNIRLLVGSSLSFSLVTTAKGSGYYDGYYLNQYWVKDERNSKDLSRFNFGVDLGLEFLFPLNEKLDLLVQNRYFCSVNSVVKMNGVGYTPLAKGQLNLGFRYRLGE